MDVLHSFLLNQAILYGVSYLAFFVLGAAVKAKRIRVNYTRKMAGFIFFTTGVVVDGYFLRMVPFAGFICTLIVIGYFLTFLEPFRKRIPFLDTCFAAVARPEDAPHTVAWITTEFAAQYVAIQLCMAAYQYFGVTNLIIISIFIVTLADGLAEPIGVRFGKHPYSTRALFGGKRYVRTLEGSLCVFIVSAFIMAFFHRAFTFQQFLLAVLLVPAGATTAEAVSPHTWDGLLIHVLTASMIILISILA